MALVGNSKHSLDAKGRLTIPSRFREDLGDRFMVARGTGGCLCAYTCERWEKMRRALSEFPVFNQRLQDFKRSIIFNASECEVDSMGRILIPQGLRETVGIRKDVVLVGGLDYLEIWDSERMKERTVEEAFDALTEDEKKSVEELRIF